MFDCKIYVIINEEKVYMLDKQFKTLKLIAEELGITYQQAADLSSRREIKKYTKFKFFSKYRNYKNKIQLIYIYEYTKYFNN